MTFFDEKKAAAVLKHGILKRYLRPFASKTGKAHPEHRVVFLDGFAGPGIYDDGNPGSPVLAAATADAISEFRTLEGIYVEEDPASVGKLRSALGSTQHRHEVLEGAVEDNLDRCLGMIGDAPAFVFLDPFGLGISFDAVVSKILGRPRTSTGKRIPTELLLNFSYPGIRRTAGHLAPDDGTDARYGKARATILERVDRTLGGDWWRPIWESGAKDREEQIADRYVDMLIARNRSLASVRVPVANRWKGRPVYDLMFFTQHEDGLWAFNEALSGAMGEYYDYCHRDELELSPLRAREAEWVAEISKNLAARLAEGRAVIVRNEFAELYGRALGYAREKHIRAAVKVLYAEGKTPTDGTGVVRTMKVLPLPG